MLLNDQLAASSGDANSLFVCCQGKPTPWICNLEPVFDLLSYFVGFCVEHASFYLDCVLPWSTAAGCFPMRYPGVQGVGEDVKVVSFVFVTF